MTFSLPCSQWPPTRNNSTETSHNPTPRPKNLFSEPPATGDTVLVDGILPTNSRNTTTHHVENLAEINPLPDLAESQRQQEKMQCIYNKDNPHDFNTLTNCVTNHEKQRANPSVEKETPVNDHIYLIAWPTAAHRLLLVQGNQTILITTLTNRKQEMKILHLTLAKPLPTAVTFTSWNR